MKIIQFNDAFFELAEERQRHGPSSNRVFSALETTPSSNNSNNNTNTIRQVERIRQRVEAQRERDDEQMRRQRNAVQREQSARDDAKRELDAQVQKQVALKREALMLRAQALVDPRNAPFAVVQLFPFSNWRPTNDTSSSSSSSSSSASSSATPSAPAEAVIAVSDSGATAAIVVSRQDPALLAEVASLRDQVAEIEALRARLAEHSIVERGRSIARNAAREAEVQVDALASSWRSTVAGARSNDVLIDSLAAAVASAESTAALDEQRRVRADAQCREVREELLAQLRSGDANRDISGLVRRYADCARNSSNQ
jgi:hypothetical protein